MCPSQFDLYLRGCVYVYGSDLPSVITTAITQVAANKLKIKTDAKCDLGSSHCYPAIVDPPDPLFIGVANESIATNLANTKNRDTARTEKIKR